MIHQNSSLKGINLKFSIAAVISLKKLEIIEDVCKLARHCIY